MRTSEKVADFKYRPNVEPDEVPIEELVRFIKMNRFKSDYARYKHILDRCEYYIMFYGCQDKAATNDLYFYFYYVLIPGHDQLILLGKGDITTSSNDDGSIATAKEADSLVINEAWTEIKGLYSNYNNIGVPKKTQLRVVVSCIQWYNSFLASGGAWPAAPNTAYYCELMDTWFETYQLQISQHDTYKAVWDDSFDNPEYTSFYTSTAYQNFLYNIFDSIIMLENPESSRDPVKEFVQQYTLQAVDDKLNALVNKHLQPTRGDYTTRPSYLGGTGFEYAPMTYLTYEGRLGLIMPEGFEIDDEATRSWWTNGGRRSIEKWNSRMNFVLINMIGADEVPLLAGGVQNYSVYLRSPKSQPPKPSDTRDNYYIHMRNKYFMYPIAENISFEIPEGKAPVFPPLKKLKRSQYYINNRRNRKTVHHPYRREWEIYNFYHAFGNKSRLHQVDYILIRLRVRRDVVKGAQIMVGLMLTASRALRFYAHGARHAQMRRNIRFRAQNPKPTGQWVNTQGIPYAEPDDPFDDIDIDSWGSEE